VEPGEIDEYTFFFLHSIDPTNSSCTANYYQGIDPLAMTATEQTGYKWSFASNKSRADEDALRAAREEVGVATHRKSSLLIGSGSGPSGSGRVQGPTLPSAADLTLAQELTSDLRDKERVHQRKRDKAETKNRIEEMVGPREVGREGMLEKKNVRRESDRAFREKGDDGLEADESTLLGGGDSFRDQVARRDASRRKYDKKAEGKNNELRERANVFKEKEKATMDMFQQLAKQRFG